jgi:hypothetical protein
MVRFFIDTPAPYDEDCSMSPTTKLTGFAAALACVFGAAAVAGGAIDPDPGSSAASAEHGDAQEAHGAGPHSTAAADGVRGLAVADHGLRLVVDDSELRRGAREQLRFRIVEADGSPVRDFDREHERRMHTIVVRRDLTGFQHVHPRMGTDGTWAVPLRLGDAGSYRVFADFSHDGEARTLAADLRVDGPAELRPLPAESAVATTGDGYEVRLSDAGNDLSFEIRRDGRPVETEPYLGAGGHLVALREGDLAFLHVHPADHGAVRFATEFPSSGRYRLFLQFKHEGRVHTAAFTREVS